MNSSGVTFDYLYFLVDEQHIRKSSLQLVTQTLKYWHPSRQYLRLHYTRLFPDPRFCFLYSKILPVTKMRLNVCFNEMALFGPFAALIRGCSSYGRNGGQPTRGDG